METISEAQTRVAGLPVPQEEEGSHAVQLLHHLRLGWLLHHLSPRWVWAGYVFINGFLTIGLLGLLGAVTHSAFSFPSLGPTAYLFFFTPMAQASSPRNAILGHAVGLACGFGAFWCFVQHASWIFGHPGSHWPKILAAAVSLSFTGALMVLFRISHPPAGATTLIVSLGILSRPQDLFFIEAAVFLLTAQALLINRLAGLPYPWWHSPQEKPRPS